MKKNHTVRNPGLSSEAPRFWNIASISEDEGEIVLYGEICSKHPVDWWTGEKSPGLFITPEGFLEDLEAVKNKSKLTIRINSIGGDLYTGIALHSTLTALPAYKTVIIDGIAASAATLPACAGDEVQVYPGSIIMVHQAMLRLSGSFTATDLNRQLQMTDAGERAVAEIYAAKTGKEIKELREMMNKETWLVGHEAVDAGFADILMNGKGPELCLSADRNVLKINGQAFNVKEFQVPDWIPISKEVRATPPQKTYKKKEGSGIMAKTWDELQLESPDLASELLAQANKAAMEEAVKKEQERLAAIDEIAGAVGDPVMVRQAKYGKEACSAEILALRAMKKQAEIGGEFLNNLAADYAQSGAGKVDAAPNSGTGETENPEQWAKRIAAIAEEGSR